MHAHLGPLVLHALTIGSVPDWFHDSLDFEITLGSALRVILGDFEITKSDVNETEHFKKRTAESNSDSIL